MKPLFAALQSTSNICQGPLCDRVGPEGVSNLMSVAIRMVFIVGGILLLLFILTGALQYITSGGDKEKLSQARDRILHASIGMIILVLSYGIWILIVSDILGIFGPGGAIILPTLQP